jgi:NitT/TauT family transport system substrate-binding protein
MKKITLIILCFMLVFSLASCGTNNQGQGEVTAIQVGTWKTPQTITPFFYQDFMSEEFNVNVVPFTNPGDMKTALLAESLDLCGTTIVTAITNCYYLIYIYYQ